MFNAKSCAFQIGLWAASVSALCSFSVEANVLYGPIINPANGHAYSLLDTQTWTDSEAEATSLGAHLVTIRSDAENTWVFNTFVPLLPNTFPATLWIGLNDAAVEGHFVWASGEPVFYTHWQAPQQPDNARGNEVGVQMCA